MAAIVTEDGNWSNDRLMGQTFNIQRAQLQSLVWPWSLEQRDVQQWVNWESGGRGQEGGGGGRSFSAQLPRGQEATVGQGKGEEQLKGLNGTWTNVKRGTFIENMLAKCTRMLLPLHWALIGVVYRLSTLTRTVKMSASSYGSHYSVYSNNCC